MTSITDPRGITFLRNTYDVNSRVCEQEQADGGKFRFYYITTDRATLPESTQLLQQASAGGPIATPPCSIQSSRGTVVATVIVDPLGYPTTHRFNGAGYVISTTDALGQTTVMEREEGTNLLLLTTDPLGRTTRFAYDDLGNVTSLTDPAGNVRRFEYEPTFNKLTQLMDPLGNITTFTYDAWGNLLSIADPLGHVTRLASNEFGQPVSTTDPLGNVTTFIYDLQGNLAAVTDPLGNTTRRMYDLVSRLIAQTDPRGQTTRFTYDALNRIEQIVDALNGVTVFSYDGNGNLLTVTDARGNTTTHAYDAMDRLASRTDPVGGGETFAYDEAGNLMHHTDRKGQVNTFAYDRLNRRIGAAYADATTTSFVYDAVGRLVQAEASSGGTILNEYDTLDRLITQRTGLGTLSYAYDALGRRTQMAATGQAPVAYDYDANARLIRITQGHQVVDFAYDALGRRTRLTLPNGVSTEYSYDAASRLTDLIYRNTTGLLGNLTYEYDAAGNRTSMGGSFARTLLPHPVASASYDAANRQHQFGDQQMTFDANGNLTSITDPSGTTTLSWDSRNRLIRLDGSGTNASFIYDPLGRRTAKQINGRFTQYLYDGVDIVQEVMDGVPINSLRSLLIDELLMRNETEYPLADSLGSTVGLSTSAGTLDTEHAYEAYGTTKVVGTSSNPFGFTGRENEGTTNLYFYRARYYDPTTGRFISEDPIGFNGGMNFYIYVDNNPTNFVDPLGWDKNIDDFNYRQIFWDSFWEGMYKDFTEKTLAVELLDALPFHIPSLIEEMLSRESTGKRVEAFLQRVGPDVFLEGFVKGLDWYHRFNQMRRLPNTPTAIMRWSLNLGQEQKSIKQFKSFKDFYDVWKLYYHQFGPPSSFLGKM